MNPSQVYPRVCGGTDSSARALMRRAGLSPRLRGNQRGIWPPGPLDGSIPASAGEPTFGTCKTTPYGVYPRVCGGTEVVRGEYPDGGGLSPRLRGNLNTARASRSWSRSIPASAGEPSPPAGSGAAPWVYPRVCGGTTMHQAQSLARTGLSPRLRGNLQTLVDTRVPKRSIPASAGEPPPPAQRRRGCRVYPRVCGGTARTPLRQSAPTGLSPRLRGNLENSMLPGMMCGSIPASAGEPQGCGRRVLPLQVYPRVCGGTTWTIRGRVSSDGLSPRLRGNLLRRTMASPLVGSIPASAGEPRPARTWSCPGWVYPRVCGGTGTPYFLRILGTGLSPRLRGNHPGHWYCKHLLRSIPASAGEPFVSSATQIQMSVYPRVCGGTFTSKLNAMADEGLSPRLRGNLGRITRALPPTRSIPASAGEPGGWCLCSGRS